MKKGFILTVMLISVLALGFSQSASWTVTNTATWVEAVGAIRSGGNNKEYIITVIGNISIPSSTENTFGSVTGITVTIQGNGTLTPSANGSLLFIGAVQTIIVKDLTLQGRNSNNAAVVKIENSGTFRMEGRATVTGNISPGDCGVYVKGGVFTMQDSATVSGNTTSVKEKQGGGVYIIDGTFTMHGGMISNNTNTYGYGGGVHVERSTFTMEGGTITGNSGGNGGGVNILSATFIMKGGTITGNSAGSGGGVSISTGTFTMQGGTILNNAATYGGGVSIGGKYGTFTMQNGTITGNNATYGGGVDNSGIFTMQDGTISNNTATNGGGVWNHETFAMQGGAISNNTATYNGGGVYNNYGTFTMQNNVSVSGNTAAAHGGGVYNSYSFLKFSGTIYGDDAEQNLKNTAISRLGHAMYNEQNNAWRNATAGQTMNSDSYGFWLNDGGDVIMFPTDFVGGWRRQNFDNLLTLTLNSVKSSSSNYIWILQKISGNAYTFKRSDTANTLTLTIRLDGNNLVISGDSGNGQDNWNGTWRKR